MQLITPSRVYYIAADEASSLNDWIKVMEPFLEEDKKKEEPTNPTSQLL